MKLDSFTPSTIFIKLPFYDLNNGLLFPSLLPTLILLKPLYIRVFIN